MPKIIQLDPHLANLIAAGEVVERPASVVKELVENAIDAGAKTVTVELQNGGMTFLRVSDDGCGMSREDAKTAFLRHATSKLRSKEDLAAIGTLGFRGEALAATAAVSRVDLLTRCAEDLEGTHLTLEAGKLLSCEAAGCPVGTTIVVRDLFFNTPARMKFMKRDTVEASAAASALQKQALAHPEISFRLIKDGQSQLQTPGDGDLLAAIYAVLGRQAAGEMVPVDSKWEKLGLSGYVSRPTATRGTRANQIFFVNQRYIRSRTMTAALEEAYRNQLMAGRFPSCVLNLSMPLSAVDVNVHPAKTEVKFLNEREIFDCVHYGVLGALNRTPGQVQFAFGGGQATGNRQQATGSGAGIRDQGSGFRGGSEFRVQSSAPLVGGGVLDAPPSAAPRSDEATGNRQQATGDVETGPSAPLRGPQDDNNGAGSARRDGSQPSAPWGEAADVASARRDGSQPSAPSEQGIGNREPGIGGTGPSAPLRCAQDDEYRTLSAVGAAIGRPQTGNDRFFKAMSAEEYRRAAKPQVHTLTRWEYEQMTKALEQKPLPAPSQALRDAVRPGTLNSPILLPGDGEEAPVSEPARRDGSQPSAPWGEAAGAALARSGEHCSPWADEATGNRQQATGQGTGNREAGIGGTGPSAPLRCAQDDEYGALSARRDGSQPSAPSGQGTGNGESEIGDGGTGPSAPLRCAQDDNTGASVPVGVSLPLAGVEQAPDFRYIGEVFRTYILVEQGEELILIDKHAAHERINFERLLAQGTRILGQTLLQPQACSFDREEAAVLLEHRELLLSLGYDLDDLGQGDLLLRQIPSDIRESDAAAILSEIAGHIQDGRLDSPQRLRDEALHSIACKAAIKAGYITDPAELRQLAAAVLNNPNLKYCPHGRPICSFITKKQIEKQFKRIT